MVSRGRLLIEAIDREHRRAQSRILAATAEIRESEPDGKDVDDAPIRPKTWLE
ncbi:MAG TPA: hypothetical protein VIW24_25330 [Aldersonia sp.]